jgi:hypothetical protein
MVTGKNEQPVHSSGQRATTLMLVNTMSGKVPPSAVVHPILINLIPPVPAATAAVICSVVIVALIEKALFAPEVAAVARPGLEEGVSRRSLAVAAMLIVPAASNL